MQRLLFAPLLFLFVLPLFAQDEQAPLAQPLPRNQTHLLQAKDKLSREIQQIQQLLGVVSPSDAHYETLKTQQAELLKQLKDISQQMQTSDTPSASEVQTTPSIRPTSPMAREVEIPAFPPRGTPIMPNSAPQMPPMYSGDTPFQRPYYHDTPYNQNPMGGPMGIPDAPPWLAQDRSWEASAWGPRVPKELIEVKQSVESMRKEIADLKDTIKALETQIQLLSRNILLSEKVRENAN